MNSLGQQQWIAADVDTSVIAVLTVTFHPDTEQFARQVAALPPDAMLVVVDNASTEAELNALEQVIGDRSLAKLLRNETNVGLAAAINQGAKYIATIAPAREFLLLMDQDSEPQPRAIEHLLRSFLHIEKAGMPVGCVGPSLVDTATGLQHGFHCMRGWRWFRVFPVDSGVPVECANLNGSGTLVRLSLFERLSGLDEYMFIDHVDTDWAFRVLDAGFGLYGIPEAIFEHGMGERGLRFWWFGWRVWPQRSPLRHYYLFRNAVLLMHRHYVPAVWKCWAIVKLAMTFMIHLLFDRQRFGQVAAMLRGIRVGLGMRQHWSVK